MEWTDSAIVLSTRPHGETSIILDVLSREHGRHAGLVRGSRGRALLQPGNGLTLHWRARLAEHLGSFTPELARARAGILMESRDALTGLNAFTAMAGAVLPERLAYPRLFDGAQVLLDAMTEGAFDHWGPLYVRWEVGLLEALGFGLELQQCAVTGQDKDLVYVSPRTGRAVSRGAGTDYATRMLALPGFLNGGTCSPGDIRAGLALTGHFLAARVLGPHGKSLPAARLRLGARAGESE